MIYRFPKVANRSCVQCAIYQFNESTGFVDLARDGKTLLTRLPQFPTPCRVPNKGCAKGTPENLNTLNEINQRVYKHYLECVAVRQFPDDAVVRRNAATIREVISEFERDEVKSDRRELANEIGLLLLTTR